ncbi:HAD hydrolase-like protein [Halobacillus sp. Nhm2S1]|uniref:HAD family hydrolase n=1 Tax=Halobacillus sp. Nhm2S1 TaxID=2866716 RepID=UPI001C72C9E1|nr:HAD hydrolase-like protein [Halobacillus sp. Nhm2S1]MBX0356917.1 HAD hydrolase-like protein [Halobacillus sp. Nhm2S1]
MLRAIIFDMDGTLFQTEKILEVSLVETFDHLRDSGEWEGETPLQKYKEIMGVPLPTVWKTLLPHHSEEIRHQANVYFLEKLILNIQKGKGALYPHVEETLEALHEEGYSLYIASNGLIHYLQAIVEYYRLDRWVTETFSIEQIDSLDKADLVAAIQEKYDFKQGAVVGDRLSDIQAAEKNGLTSIGCRFDFAQEAELAEADHVIDDFPSLNEVIRVIEKLHV